MPDTGCIAILKNLAFLGYDKRIAQFGLTQTANRIARNQQKGGGYDNLIFTCV